MDMLICILCEIAILCFSSSAIGRIVNRPADGGITALHMAALNGHADCVILLLDLMADVSAATMQDGTTIDLIGIFCALMQHIL